MFRAVRRFASSSFARGAHGHGSGGLPAAARESTVPGENLPFSIGNRYRLTLVFTLFYGSAIGLPFLMLKHQLTK